MVHSYNTSRPSLLERLKWWCNHPRGFFLRILGIPYRFLYANEPWISFRAIRFCEVTLHREMVGFEWGSGNSTLWFGKRLKKLVSIEHDPKWHRLISEKIKTQNFTNIDYRLIPLDHPTHLPTLPTYEELPQYIQEIEEFTHNFFDFISIDGHYRMACVPVALKHLKPGGLLLIDNTEWLDLALWNVPKSWKLLHRSKGFESETTIWKKPEDTSLSP